MDQPTQELHLCRVAWAAPAGPSNSSTEPAPDLATADTHREYIQLFATLAKRPGTTACSNPDHHRSSPTTAACIAKAPPCSEILRPEPTPGRNNRMAIVTDA